MAESGAVAEYDESGRFAGYGFIALRGDPGCGSVGIYAAGHCAAWIGIVDFQFVLVAVKCPTIPPSAT